MKVATFFPTPRCFGATCYCYSTVARAIKRDLDIKTTQMCMLNKVKDYDVIRIAEGPDDVIEITNNHDGTYSCDRTQRVLRRTNDFFKLWENGEFR